MIKLESLSSNHQFRRLLSQEKIHTSYFTIYFSKNLFNKKNRKLNISFITKKKLGSAVMRNKIKRRLRSAVQKNLQNKKTINIDYSYIIFGKSKTFSEKYAIISDELDKTFSKINRMNA